MDDLGNPCRSPHLYDWRLPMTLTQRLTRAGATFIVFGVVAAILPHQADSAIADNPCTVPGHTFEIRNSLGATSTTYTLILGSADTYTSYFDTTQGGAIGASGGSATFTTVSPSSVVVTTNTGTSSPSSSSLKATDTVNGTEYIASATVNY